MRNVKVKYDFNYTDMHKLFIDNYERTMLLVAATLQTQRAMIFNAEGAYNGRRKWKPLKKAEAERKILSLSGALRGSISPSQNNKSVSGTPTVGTHTILNISGNKVTIGSSLKYAAVHDKGLTINRKGTTKKGVTFQYSIKMPKRSFLDITDQDKQEIGDTLVNFLTEVLNNG